ncbi:hypothetical protein GF312_19940 [Candidatus Poribacteria bacterium]|nr:hypothetical protein [Candidatus Poribacteria bacterium]
MKYLTIILWLFVFIMLSACAHQTYQEKTYGVESAPVEKESHELTEVYGPLERTHRALRPIEAVFRDIQAVRNANRFTLSELKAITGSTNFKPLALSGCNINAVKILLAKDWVPVVIIRTPTGRKHIRAIIGYDDNNSRITLIDVLNLKQASKANISYSDFDKQWDDPRKTCLLIFSDYIGKQRIEFALRKHLSEDEFNSIIIDTVSGM